MMDFEAADFYSFSGNDGQTNWYNLLSMVGNIATFPKKSHKKFSLNFFKIKDTRLKLVNCG